MHENISYYFTLRITNTFYLFTIKPKNTKKHLCFPYLFFRLKFFLNIVLYVFWYCKRKCISRKLLFNYFLEKLFSKEYFQKGQVKFHKYFKIHTDASFLFEISLKSHYFTYIFNRFNLPFIHYLCKVKQIEYMYSA